AFTEPFEAVDEGPLHLVGARELDAAAHDVVVLRDEAEIDGERRSGDGDHALEARVDRDGVVLRRIEQRLLLFAAIELAVVGIAERLRRITTARIRLQQRAAPTRKRETEHDADWTRHRREQYQSRLARRDSGCSAFERPLPVVEQDQRVEDVPA